jgi:putative peptidoglycan lipid II flippase
MYKRLFQASILVFLGILAGRALGFLREVLIAHQFGVTRDADIAVLVLTVPDIFLNILVGGAATAVLVPEFTKHNKDKAWTLFVQSTFVMFTFFLVVTFAISFFSNELVTLFAPGFDENSVFRSSKYLIFALASLPISAITAVSTSYLQSKDHFAIPSFGTFIYNFVIIVVMLFASGLHDGLFVLALVICLASIFRYVSQFILAFKHRGRYASNGKTVLDRGLLNRYFQALGTVGLIFLIPVISRVFSSFHGEGAVAAMNYANKFIELPLGAVISVLPVVMFPKLSEMFQSDSKLEAENLGSKAAFISFYLAVILTSVLALYVHDYIGLLFNWGTVDSLQLIKIEQLTQIGLLALPAMGLSSIFIAVFNAKKDTSTPLLITAAAVIIYIPIAWFFGISYGLKGLMASYVLINWLLMITQFIVLTRFLKVNIWSDILNIRFLINITVSLGICFILTWAVKGLQFGSIVNIIMSVITTLIICLIGMYLHPSFRELLRKYSKKRVVSND